MSWRNWCGLVYDMLTSIVKGSEEQFTDSEKGNYH